jgi:sigma-B regulation protein RsbU (phosphoserine phosphatase)
MSYTNAGHNPPIVIRADATVLRLETGGAVLGVLPDWKYLQDQIQLTPGDRLVLFTDGLIEAQNSNGHEFGEDRLLDLLRNYRELSAQDLQKKLIEAIKSFSSGDFSDDVTFVIMSVS